MAERRAVRVVVASWFWVAAPWFAGCALTTSGEGTPTNGEPELKPSSESPPSLPTPTADAPARTPAAPPPTVMPPAGPVPTAPMAPVTEPTCGVDWDNPRALVPSEPGIVGTFNGRPFAVPPERVHVELDCEARPGQPPPLHLGFELEEERLVFVIRRCEGIAYLPDNTAITLQTDASDTLGSVSSDGSAASGGHFRLLAPAAVSSEAIDLEFTVSVALEAPGAPPGIPCAG